MVTLGAVREKEYFLLPVGEYILTLSEIEESQGQWGERLIFKFLAAPPEDFSAYICKPSGDEVSLWSFTDRDIVLGSMIHEFVEALTGRKFAQDDEPPHEDDLLGNRIVAYVTHETPTKGKSAGKKREAIVAGSIKPFRVPGKKIAANAPAKAAPTDDEAARKAVVARIEKLVGRAVKLETPNHASFVALDLNDMTVDVSELEMLVNTISEEIAVALDA